VNDVLASGVFSGNVFTNDTDADGVFVDGALDKSKWTASLVSGTSSGTLTLNGNGSFTFVPSTCGQFTFQYKINPGTFSYQVNGVGHSVALSDDSNAATVTITAPCVFVPVQNVPPPSNKTTKPGNSLAMQWQYKAGTTVVNSAAVTYTITVTGPLPGTTQRVYTTANPGSSSFQYNATTNIWTFNLLTKEANGTNYPVGTYNVQIVANTPGYNSSPVFQIVLK